MLGGCNEEGQKRGTRERRGLDRNPVPPRKRPREGPPGDSYTEERGTNARGEFKTRRAASEAAANLTSMARGAVVKTWSFKPKRRLPGAQCLRIRPTARCLPAFGSFALRNWTTAPEFTAINPERTRNNRQPPVISLRHPAKGGLWQRQFTKQFQLSAGRGRAQGAGRHYSLVDYVQSKDRGRMQPKSVERRCLFRAELLQEIAESAGKANHRLKTVDEAAAENTP